MCLRGEKDPIPTLILQLPRLKLVSCVCGRDLSTWASLLPFGVCVSKRLQSGAGVRNWVLIYLILLFFKKFTYLSER